MDHLFHTILIAKNRSLVIMKKHIYSYASQKTGLCSWGMSEDYWVTSFLKENISNLGMIS